MASSLDNEQRREFIRRSLMMIPAVGIGSGVALTANAAEQPLNLSEYTPVFFDADEWRFMLAACDRLIPADSEGPGALETNVPIFIDKELTGDYGHASDWYMEGPHFPDAPPALGFQLPYTPRDIYRQGIALTQRFCQNRHGKPFEALDEATRDQVLSALEKNEVDFKSLGEKALSAKEFFDFMLQNTKEGYLSDPIYGGNKHMAAWKMIGFTGARANFREWVDQYDVPYPLGPVSLAGERG